MSEIDITSEGKNSLRYSQAREDIGLYLIKSAIVLEILWIGWLAYICLLQIPWYLFGQAV
jgi:hypothetical protein